MDAGVGIQEETVGELSRAEDGMMNQLDGALKYFTIRAKALSKVCSLLSSCVESELLAESNLA